MSFSERQFVLTARAQDADHAVAEERGPPEDCRDLVHVLVIADQDDRRAQHPLVAEDADQATGEEPLDEEQRQPHEEEQHVEAPREVVGREVRGDP